MIDKLIRFENGQMTNDEVVEFFQDLVDTCIIHRLQGCYQRMAQDLMNQGLIVGVN